MTFGIVTFLRPGKLSRLVASIREFYPDAHIVIADNGRKLPQITEKLTESLPGTETYVMPFDCGLSVCRNHLLQNTEGDLLLLDDDYVFTSDTRLEKLQEVLDADDEVGIVAGSAGFTDPELFDGDELEWKYAGGVRYCICHKADNFLLIRREAIADGICWNPGLKVGEHLDFFKRVRDTKWKVAFVPDVKVEHERGGDEEYLSFRNRAGPLSETIQKGSDPPPVVVFGVGHSGTSIVVRILEQFGFHLGEVKPGVAENLAVQSINKRILSRRLICPCGSDKTELASAGGFDCLRCQNRHRIGAEVDGEEFDAALDLPHPWVIKDPRMVLTLDDWKPHLSRFNPLLLMVERNLPRMRQTYDRYRFDDFRIYGHSVPELQQIARWQFQIWGGRKFAVQYEQIAEAVKLFDMKRAH